MTGLVRKLVREKAYGFIQSGETDYFMHKSGFDGHWDDLCDDLEKGITVEVEFEVVRSEKGLRAEEIRRTHNG